MQLVTYRHADAAQDRIGVLDGDGVIDLTAAVEPASDLEREIRAGRGMCGLLAAGDAGLALARAAQSGGAAPPVPMAEVTLRAPLPRPNSMRDFMLVEEHVRNSLGHVPDEWYEIPVYWKGNCDTVFGPEDIVPWPSYTDKLDYELEVGAIIGRRAYRVDAEQAAGCIAGYTIFNDWSARDIQFREMKVGLGPGLGKDFATSLGPCITTADAIDINTAAMSARVNGETWSEGTLGSMRFSFCEVIAHLSQEQPLQPGDVLGSGTVGRGCGLEIDRWLQPGDLVELEVEGIGILRNRVGQRPATG
ncbi:MAG: fumarylacetoacetate hydrolase family protein [Pseudonocardiaceae bacterium]|nr:fumarylacetoacetate hydrolase family protein [Pseudonocardiaceae bacterium]